jgi:hypothetical protein
MVAGRPHRIPMTGATNLLAALQALERLDVIRLAG